jgi:hypothetical protein
VLPTVWMAARPHSGTAGQTLRFSGTNQHQHQPPTPEPTNTRIIRLVSCSTLVQYEREIKLPNAHSYPY